MKALTLKQPWAYLICVGIKDIENRTWKCPKKYIGQRILIHAGSSIDKTPLTAEQIEYVNDYMSQRNMLFLRSINEFEKSAIIGSIEIVDCVFSHTSIWAEKPDTVFSGKTGKIVQATWNWVLANPICFDKPIFDVKGRLGFWNFDLLD